jgi:hypothetical protein
MSKILMGMIPGYAPVVAALVLLGAAPRADRGPASETMHSSGIVVLHGVEPLPDPLPEKVAVTLGKALELSKEHPSDFTYPWPDRALGRVVLPVVTERGSLIAQELAGGPEDVDQIDTARLAPSRLHTRSYLDDIMDRVIGRQPEGVVVRSAFPDPEHNRIVIELAELDEALLQRLAASWDPSAIAVRLVEDVVGGPGARHNDTSPFFGGAILVTAFGPENNTCTSGFPWRSGTTHMMLTAAHCFPSGGGVATPAQHMGSIRGGVEENWTAGVGTVLMTGETTYVGDVALVRLQTGTSSAATIYQGPARSTTTRAVREMWSRPPARGDQYCTGGAVSGELCGWAVTSSAAGNHTYTRTGELARRVWRGQKRGHCFKGGDSGGPVYTVRSDGGVAAKGICSGETGHGGSDAFAGALDAPCVNIFTDIRDAYFSMPGSLAVR